MDSCPCDEYGKEECDICNDNQFSDIQQKFIDVIWEQKETINKLKYDLEIANGKLYIVKTVMEADK